MSRTNQDPGTQTRRRFLKHAAAGSAAVATAPYIIPSSALGLAGATAPSERVTLGCIGVGGRGWLNTRMLMAHGGQVLAVCDVNAQTREARKREVEANYAEAARSGLYKGCDTYNDFRELVARDDIDGVMVGTPDHWHVPIAIAAVEAGKDVYVEKPLGMSIAECQAMRDAVRRYGVVFQHGTEQRARAYARIACELVRNGRLGELKTIQVGGPGGALEPTPKPEDVPEHLDYDMWLGPAPYRPFNSRCCLRNGHWFIRDFAATGFIAGWGIHYLDIVHWAIDADETGPVEIEGRAEFPEEGLFDTAYNWEIDYGYASGARVHYTNDTRSPGDGRNPHGIRFEGSEGWLHLSYNKPLEAEPASLLKTPIGPDEIHLYEADSDDQDFLEAVKTRGRTCSPIEAAHSSTTVCFLGDIACRLGRKLEWDPKKERFANDDEANRLLGCSHRAPWRV